MERKSILIGAIIGLILLIILEFIHIFIKPLSVNVYVVGYIICLFIGAVVAGMKTIDNKMVVRNGVWVGVVIAIIYHFFNYLTGIYSFISLYGLIMVVINTLVWALIFGSIGGKIGKKLFTL